MEGTAAVAGAMPAVQQVASQTPREHTISVQQAITKYIALRSVVGVEGGAVSNMLASQKEKVRRVMDLGEWVGEGAAGWTCCEQRGPPIL